jgi:hypothetical protein
LTPGDQATVYIPIFKCMLQEPNYLYPAGITNNLLVRLWWRGGCVLSSSNIEVVTLLMQAFSYDASIRQSILSRYMSGPKIDFRFANRSCVLRNP